jgi:hypothetical protein
VEVLHGEAGRARGAGAAHSAVEAFAHVHGRSDGVALAAHGDLVSGWEADLQLPCEECGQGHAKAGGDRFSTSGIDVAGVVVPGRQQRAVDEHALALG